MPKIEIDENEYVELKRVADVAKLIGGNPKARELLQEAVSVAAPEQAGPEIRIRKEVTERIGGIEKKLDDWFAAQQKERDERADTETKREFEQKWLSGRAKAREAGYTDEGLDKLEKYMEEKGVADHEVAIPAFERLNPPPEPVTSGNSHFNFFDFQGGNTDNDNMFKRLMSGDTEGFLEQSVPLALKEVRGR